MTILSKITNTKIMAAMLTMLAAMICYPAAHAHEPVDATPVDTVAVTNAEGHLVFPNGNTIDLGSINIGEKPTGEILYGNDGAESIAVVSAFAECGCTMVQYDKEPLPPGHTARLSVTFDSSNRSHGNFTKAVRLRTNTGQIALVIVKGKIRRKYSGSRLKNIP